MIELMIVLALMGVLASSAVTGYAAWKRSSVLQEAVTGVQALLRSVHSSARDQRMPCRLTLTVGPEGSLLAAERCEVDGSSAKNSQFVAYRKLQLSPQVAVVEPAASASWILDSGGVLVDPVTGELPASGQLRIVLAAADLSSLRWQIDLEMTGRITTSVPERRK